MKAGGRQPRWTAGWAALSSGAERGRWDGGTNSSYGRHVQRAAGGGAAGMCLVSAGLTAGQVQQQMSAAAWELAEKSRQMEHARALHSDALLCRSQPGLGAGMSALMGAGESTRVSEMSSQLMAMAEEGSVLTSRLEASTLREQASEAAKQSLEAENTRLRERLTVMNRAAAVAEARENERAGDKESVHRQLQALVEQSKIEVLRALEARDATVTAMDEMEEQLRGEVASALKARDFAVAAQARLLSERDTALARSEAVEPSEQLQIERDVAAAACEQALAMQAQLQREWDSARQEADELHESGKLLQTKWLAAEAAREEAVASRDEQVVVERQLRDELAVALKALDEAVTVHPFEHAVGLGEAMPAPGQWQAQADAALKARDEAVAVQGQLKTQRDAALKALDESVVAQDQLESEKHAALEARDEAVVARDQMISERQSALAARDEAIAVQYHTEGERNAALKALDDSVTIDGSLEAERDAEVAAAEGQMRRELNAALEARDEALRMQEQLRSLVVHSSHAALQARDEVLDAQTRLQTQDKDSQTSRLQEERDAATEARDKAVAEQQQLVSERDAALQARDEAVSVQEQVRVLLVKSSNAALKARDEALNAQRKLQSELDDAIKVKERLLQAHAELGDADLMAAESASSQECVSNDSIADLLLVNARLKQELDATTTARDDALAGQESLKLERDAMIEAMRQPSSTVSNPLFASQDEEVDPIPRSTTPSPEAQQRSMPKAHSSQAIRTHMEGIVSEDTQDAIKAGLVRTQMEGIVSEDTQDAIKAGLVARSKRPSFAAEVAAAEGQLRRELDVAERDAALKERDEALKLLKQVRRERDMAVKACDEASGALREARKEGMAALRHAQDERDVAVRAQQAVAKALEQTTAERDAAVRAQLGAKQSIQGLDAAQLVVKQELDMVTQLVAESQALVARSRSHSSKHLKAVSEMQAMTTTALTQLAAVNLMPHANLSNPKILQLEKLGRRLKDLIENREGDIEEQASIDYQELLDANKILNCALDEADERYTALEQICERVVKERDDWKMQIDATL